MRNLLSAVHCHNFNSQFEYSHLPCKSSGVEITIGDSPTKDTRKLVLQFLTVLFCFGVLTKSH